MPTSAARWRKAWRQTVDRILEDLDQEKDKYPHPSTFPGDLIALNLFGAYEHVAFRSRFDKQYSRKDLLEAHLWLFLAAQAARNGEIDIDSRLARYEKLIAKLSSEMPPLPPELESETYRPRTSAVASAARYTNAIVPPSGYRMVPVTKSDAGDARKTAGPIRSKTVPIRPIGTFTSIFS